MAGPVQQVDPAARLGPILPTVLSVPYRSRGLDFSGWDCWGCARWGLQDLADLAPPDEPTPPPDADGGSIARAFARRQRVWQPVQPGPGTLVLFGPRGVPVHCGFLVSAQICLHAGARTGTVLTSIDHPYLPPLIGAWLPPDT